MHMLKNGAPQHKGTKRIRVILQQMNTETYMNINTGKERTATWKLNVIYFILK